MSKSRITRRDFLRASAMTAVGVVAASCAQPTPQVIEKPVTVVVEKEVQVEKEVLSTVIVEKEVAVEKVVQQTVLVEKEKVVKETVVVEKEKQVDKVITATPVVMKYKESPMLAGQVQSGELPPVDERLPEDPMIQFVHEEIGQYGGTWHRLAVSPGDIRTPDRLMSDNLLHWNKEGSEVYPNVASSYEISPDGKVFTFKLRKGMKWSDGEPFTADDVLWWPNDHLQNENTAPSYPKWFAVGGFEPTADKIDEYTVRITFGAPAGVFLLHTATQLGMEFTIYPRHYCEKLFQGYTDQAALDKMAKDAGFEFWYQHYSNKCATYSGAKSNIDLPVIHAWQLTVAPPKQPVVMMRNPYYYKVDPEGNQLPYIDRIEHMIVAGSEQVNLRAISGEVDMQMRHMTFDNFPLFMDAREKGDYRILQWKRGYITDSMICMGIGHIDPERRAFLSDKRLHYALSLGMDRPEIIDGVFLGVTEPTQISPLPSSPYYWEEAAKNMIVRDLDRANGYLDDMGLTGRDADGYRLMPDGKRATITFEYAPVFGPWGSIGELLRAQWEEIGIELVIKEYSRELFTAHDEAGETEMTMWTGSGEFNLLLENTSPFINWQGAQVFHDWNNSGGTEGEEPPDWMKKQWENFYAAKSTIDVEEQKRLVREILEIHKDQMHTIGICTAPPEVVVVKNGFRNVPEEAVSDWPLLSPGNTNPEQYFIRQ